MELLQIKCPTCQPAVLQYHTTYATQHHGRRSIYKCASCPRYFSETKKTLMAGLKTPVSVIWQVVKARTEGMGLNAAARTFEKAKNTILAWVSLSRLNHRLPQSQAHPEVVQGTADLHHQIADALLPQTEPVFDNATPVLPEYSYRMERISVGVCREPTSRINRQAMSYA